MNRTEYRGRKQIWSSSRITMTTGILLCFFLMAGMVLRAGASQVLDPSSLAEMASSLLETVADERAGEENQTGQSELYNVLLVGSDRRDSSWNGNSDTMILVSVNAQTSQIHMISFMRDLGVDIPGNGMQKLNAAFAIGGISLLKDTLLENFGVSVDNYVAVDFYEMIDIVDALGGVDMMVKDSEVDNVNMYIMSMCPYMGLNENDYMLSSGGYLHLNGMLAVAFCRVRFVGDNDYERTERQRRVLTALLGSFSTDDAEELAGLLMDLLVNTDTDVSLFSLLKVAPLLLNFSSYELSTDRVPFDGMYSSSNEMLVPQQPATNEQLAGILYGK